MNYKLTTSGSMGVTQFGFRPHKNQTGLGA